MTSDDASMVPSHVPVLMHEVVDGLALKRDGRYVDATYGRGGHSGYLLQQLGEAGCLLALDRDPEAIADAKANAERNEISNVDFFVGDMKNVFNERFIKDNGIPDVIITDPPRDGMHKDVVQQILRIAPKKVVYVSCNSATQARDLALLKEAYTVEKVQPVDMFPQTHHVENVVLLTKKN